jgi:hypothetical protein
MTGTTAPAGAGARFTWAAICLALLIGALLLSFWVATRNFAIADPARSPATARVLQMARIEGDLSQEMFSRYFASESNRALFAFMGPFQVVMALLAFLLAFHPARGGPHGRLLRALLMVAAATALLMAPLVPTMIELGRTIDFVPRQPVTPDRAAFMRWHGLYMVGDVVLLVAAVAALPLLARRRPASP